MALTIENAPDELRFSGKTGERISDAELQAVIDSILAAEAAGDEAPIKEPAAADPPTVQATFAGFAAFAAPSGTFSALASRVETTWQSDERTRSIRYFIVHHAATTELSAILSAFAGARQVSANYALGGGTLVSTVPEGRRAWTSASWYDDAAVTIEVANESAGGSWPIRQVDFVILAELIADVATRYGFPINDDTVLTHQELYQRFGESYATACPGDLQRRKGELLALARSFQAGAIAPAVQPIPSEEDDMLALKIEHFGKTHHAVLGNGVFRHLIGSDDPERVKNIVRADDQWLATTLAELPRLLRTYGCDLNIWDVRGGTLVVLDPIDNSVKAGNAWTVTAARARDTQIALGAKIDALAKVTSEQTAAYLAGQKAA